MINDEKNWENKVDFLVYASILFNSLLGNSFQFKLTLFTAYLFSLYSLTPIQLPNEQLVLFINQYLREMNDYTYRVASRICQFLLTVFY